MNDPALVAALQLLAGSISGLPQAIIAANADHTERSGGPDVGRVYVTNSNWAAPVPVVIENDDGKNKGAARSPKEAGGASALGSMGSMLLGKFAAVVGPLAVLGQVLGASTSGFATLNKAVSLFAMTIAPVLLPVTMLLATAFTAAAEVVMGMLLPGLQGFFGVVLAIGIPAIVAFIDEIKEAGETVGRWSKWVKERAEQNNVTADDASKAGGYARDAAELSLGPVGLYNIIKRRIGEYQDATAGGGGGPAAAPAKADTKTTVMNALRDVASSFSLSIGPKAQISGLEGIGKSVQLAALNQDPIEARMLRVQEQTRDAMNAVVAALGGGPGGVYVPSPHEGSWAERRMGGYRGSGGAVEGGSF